MSSLTGKHCQPCEGGVAPLSASTAEGLRRQLHTDWVLAADGKSIRREYAFKNFYRTMGFVNAVAYIANTEDHHPDIECGFNYCRIEFTTHAIGGLSENDFICAAKIDAMTGG